MLRKVSKRYEFESFVELDIRDTLRLFNNGICVSIMRGDELVGVLSSTVGLLEVITHDYKFEIIAYRGNNMGFSMRDCIAVLRYKSMGG